MKAIGYIRVSTEGQASDGVSLAAQESKIRAWAELNDHSDVEIHIDAGLSGSRADNRPALQDAIAACRKGDVLVVYSLSRLARSTRDTIQIAEQLHKTGADLVSLSEKIDTTTAAGKMVFRMLAVLSEFERDQVAERTSMAMAHKKANGERVGSVPYGFKLAADGVRLEPDASEQAAVTLAKQLRGDGQTLREIAQRLALDGFKPRGKQWHAMTVKNMVEAVA
jgi:DNA invertase Pin-like site-specific DNA recombinase